jgi:transposase
LPAFIAVGIDSSDDHHDIHAVGVDQSGTLRLRIGNDLASFLQLEARLRETFPGQSFKYALENPRSLLGNYLRQQQAALYALNPRSVVRMREALATSGKKDDPLDALALSLLLRERAAALAPVQSSSAAGTIVAGLVEQRVEVVEEQTRVTNQLQTLLKRFYPRALELFPKLEQPLTLAFLLTFASPSELRAATRTQWQQLFAGNRFPRPTRIEPLWQQSRAAQVPMTEPEEFLGALQVRRLVRRLQLLLQERESLEAEIKTRFEPLEEAKIFQSLPGAGPVLAPALFALFGDNPTRWNDWTEVARNSGTVPITRSSGKSCSVVIRRHCDHRARRTLHLFASCSLRICSWAREFYQDQRRKGTHYNTVMRNLATKWLRILFKMWKDGQPYDEDLYLKRRAERNATIVAKQTPLTSL